MTASPPTETPTLAAADYARLVCHGPLALAIWRLADGVFLEVSDPFLALLGYRRAQLLGHPDTELDIWADPAERATVLAALQHQRALAEFAAPLRRADRTLLQAAIAITLQLIGGADCAVITIRDTAPLGQPGQQDLVALSQSLDRRVQERTAALSAANAALARAARLKDEFLASMSHELRTPLNAVLGRAESLLELIHGPLNERQTRAVRSIEESGRHLLELINDILDLSKIEASKLDLRLAPVVAADLCQTSMRMVQQAAITRQIALATVIDPQIGAFVADERRLRQVLVNLLANAVKFTPAHGSVELRLSLEPAASPPQICFAVSDTGVGIPEQDLARLFQPFVQLDSGFKRQYGGTGLGLALVRRLIELHGGTVSVSSAVGQGSCFSVRIPLGAEIAPPRLVSRPSAYWSTLTIERALVVTSSPSCADQISRLLGELSIRVQCCETGQTARLLLGHSQPDLIVLDGELRDGSGWDLLAQLKAEPGSAQLPVLLIAPPNQLSQALDAGASGFISRPIERRRFQRMISTALVSSAAAGQALGLLTPHNPAPNQRILLAEDDRQNSALLLDYFTALGYHVLIAEDGVLAVQLAVAEQPALIVMDIQLPELDGLRAIRAIRADSRTAALPIIALTALTMPGDREACLAAGANDYLSKPVALRKLREAVEAQIGPSMIAASDPPTQEAARD